MHLTMLWLFWNLFVRYLTLTYILITMSCILVCYDNVKAQDGKGKEAQ